MASSSGSDIHILSPHEDSLAIPASKRPMIDDKKENIEYYFRITIFWKDDVGPLGLCLREDETGAALATLLLRGIETEREMATRYIQALYKHGPQYRDDIVAVPMDMYAFVSAPPVIRHVIRESGAVVLVTFDGAAHVYGTDLAVTLAISLFEYLTSAFEKGRNGTALQALSTAYSFGGHASSALSTAAMPSQTNGAAPARLASFVAANQANLNWNAGECQGIYLPENVESILVEWFFDDLNNMGYPVTNPTVTRPHSSHSPMTGITTSLRGASVNGGGGADDSDDLILGADGTIVIDDDEDLDVIVQEQRRDRIVRVIPRSLDTSPSKLPYELLNGLTPDGPFGASMQTDRFQAIMGSLVTDDRAHCSSSIFPPPHPLPASSTSPTHNNNNNYQGPISAGLPRHSPRPPSNKRGLADQHQDKDNIGKSKGDDISNNSNKFKPDENASTISTSADTPGINKRKIKMKNKDDDERGNPDDWMKDLSPEEVQMIMQTENIENYGSDANHTRERNHRRQSSSPPHSILPLIPPPPHQLVRCRSALDNSRSSVAPSGSLAGGPSSTPGVSFESTTAGPPNGWMDIGDVAPPLPNSYLRRVVIDGNNVAMAHGQNREYSCRGLWIAVRYFLALGHRPNTIKVFVPQWRQAIHLPHNVIKEPKLLQRELNDFVIYTPCRTCEGVRMNSYDDRFILQAASENRGVVVSNDKFRDLINESEAYREVIKQRLLPFCFLEDVFIPSPDPLGIHGPKLSEFLKIYRPEMEKYPHARPKTSACYPSLAAAPQQDNLQQPEQHQNSSQHQPGHNQQQLNPRPSEINFAPAVAAQTASNDTHTEESQPADDGRPRTKAETKECRRELRKLFSANPNQIDNILWRYPEEKDLDKLAGHVLSIIVSWDVPSCSKI